LCRNCLLTFIVEEKIEGMGRRGKRRKHLLDDLVEKKICVKLQDDAPDDTQDSLGKKLWVCPKTDYVIMVRSETKLQNLVHALK
jgi:hypothetical protein